VQPTRLSISSQFPLVLSRLSLLSYSNLNRYSDVSQVFRPNALPPPSLRFLGGALSAKRILGRWTVRPGRRAHRTPAGLLYGHALRSASASCAGCVIRWSQPEEEQLRPVSHHAQRVECLAEAGRHRGNLAPCLLDIHLPLLVPHATRSGMASANMQKSWYAQTLLGVWIGFNVEPPEQKPRGLLWRFCLCHGRLYIEASPGRAWRVFAIHTCLPLKTDGLHSTARQASWKSLVGENRTGDETPSPVSRRRDWTGRHAEPDTRRASCPAHPAPPRGRT
jgi:hypothetical protein